MTSLRPSLPLFPIAMVLTACATAPSASGTPVSAASLCDQVVEIVCQAEHDCCTTPVSHGALDASVSDASRPDANVATDAHVATDAGVAMADADLPTRDAGPAAEDCTTVQHRVCDQTLGALANDSRLGYVPERGGALVATLRTRAAGCWNQPFVPSELTALFVGTANDGERCTPHGTLAASDLEVAALSCGGGRACRLHLDGSTGAPVGECEARAVAGDEVCTHPYDCPSGRFCDIDGAWEPGVLGECQPLRSDNWDCSSDSECASAFCGADGHCTTRPAPLRCLAITYSDLVVVDGPSLYYRLGDTGAMARDTSTHAASATYVGTVTHAAGALGASDDDGALVLDGTGHVEGPSLSLPSHALTLALWVSVPAMAGGGPLVELVGGDASLRLHVDAGNIVATFADAAGHTTQLASTGAPIDTRFHRVVLVVTDTQSTLSVDGAMAATGTTQPLPSNGVLWIGMHDAPAAADQSFFHGLIDELALFDHALAAASLTRESTAAVAGTMSLTPAVFAWSE